MTMMTKNEDEITINVPPGILIGVGILIVLALLMSSVADNVYTESAKKFCASYNETYSGREGNIIHCQQGLRQIDRRVQPVYSR